jgi:hypothetical protein
MNKKKEEKKNWYFTFGCGQVHDGCYVKYFGTRASTREKMFDAFGQKWSMQYSEEQWINPHNEGYYPGKTIAERWGWKEIS